MLAKKSLGQHWLKDEATLSAICDIAKISSSDTILEIGPGLGDLTRQLLKRASKVIAVELDSELAAFLRTINDNKLEIIQADILQFDLTQLPPGYKVVANIPYYLTSNLIRILSESTNRPDTAVILVQKEVAERLAATPGQMSLLSVSAQLYFSVELGPVVRAKMFEPPPKVDSQVLILKQPSKPMFDQLDYKLFFQIVKAGFSGRRKKLRSSLAAGLGTNKATADKLLEDASISGDLRAQNLSLEDWHKLYKTYKSNILKVL